MSSDSSHSHFSDIRNTLSDTLRFPLVHFLILERDKDFRHFLILNSEVHQEIEFEYFQKFQILIIVVIPRKLNCEIFEIQTPFLFKLDRLRHILHFSKPFD